MSMNITTILHQVESKQAII